MEAPRSRPRDSEFYLLSSISYLLPTLWLRLRRARDPDPPHPDPLGPGTWDPPGVRSWGPPPNPSTSSRGGRAHGPGKPWSWTFRYARRPSLFFNRAASPSISWACLRARKGIRWPFARSAAGAAARRAREFLELGPRRAAFHALVHLVVAVGAGGDLRHVRHAQDLPPRRDGEQLFPADAPQPRAIVQAGLQVVALSIPRAVTADRRFTHAGYFAERHGEPIPSQTSRAWSSPVGSVTFF